MSCDADDNLWIKEFTSITKFDGTNITKYIDEENRPNFSPINGPTKIGLNRIKDKVYFENLNGSISYFDVNTQKFDTVNFNSNFNNNDYIVYLGKVYNDSILCFTYLINDEWHFGKYDGENFTNLDSYLDQIKYGEKLIKEEPPSVELLNNNAFLFRIHSGAGNILSDSLYMIDSYLNRYSIGYRDKSSGYDIISKDYLTLTNGKTYIPFDLGKGVISFPTSVEAPTKWLFMNKLYPNPAKNAVKVDFSVEPINLPKTKVLIYDYMGRIVRELSPTIDYNQTTGVGTMNCDINGIPTGYYILSITNSKYSKSMPLLVE